MSMIIEDVATILEDSTETILIDADLYVRYQSPEKAFKILRDAIEKQPHSIALREKLRQIGVTNGNLDIAAEQCLALASLYIRALNFDLAVDRLNEAKSLDPRISIASGFEAIRIARQRDEQIGVKASAMTKNKKPVISGDISLISIFDVVEVIENARLTGLLVLKSPTQIASIALNIGKIVDAQADGKDNISAFRKIIEMENGEFAFYTSSESFPEIIKVDSNKNFLLNSIASLEAEKAEKAGIRDLRDEEL